MRDNFGRIDKWHGTTIDIEDRKQAEAKARQAEAELRQVVDLIPAMAWTALRERVRRFREYRVGRIYRLFAGRHQGLGVDAIGSSR